MPEPTTIKTKRPPGRPKSDNRKIRQGYAVPADMVRELTKLAKARGVSASSLVTDAIRSILNQSNIKTI